MNSSFWRKISMAEWFAACLITAAVACLHWIFFRHAGALWRDEIGIINIACLPSLGEVWKTLPHDHCPILFPVLARVWSETGMGKTDNGLRILGLGIGLFLLAAFWITNRMMGRGLPLFSLSLAALNVTVITFGDSLRAYGLATAFILITFGLVWRFLEKPDWRRGLMAGIAAVLSVQTLYQNAFLLLAICLAGIALCIVRRQNRLAMAVLGIGFFAALSLLPYLHGMREAQSWWALSKTGDGVCAFLIQMIQINGGFLFVWFILLLLATTWGIGHFMSDQKMPVARQNVCFFAGAALVIGFGAYGLFFKLAGLAIKPWYCIPLLGFIAVCCDVILPRLHQATRLGVLIVTINSVFLTYPTALSKAQQPRTNGNFVAAKLAQIASPDDFVIVHPWYYSLTFAHYYQGNLEWKTLPPLENYQYHREDLLKSKMQMTNAIQPVLEKVEATLRAGHRVWLVGENIMPKSNTPPPVDLPPAPNGPGGWFDVPYSQVWGEQLGYLLSHHVINSTQIINSSTGPMEPLENMGLTVVSGWNNLAQTNSLQLR